MFCSSGQAIRVLKLGPIIELTCSHISPRALLWLLLAPSLNRTERPSLQPSNTTCTGTSTVHSPKQDWSLSSVKKIDRSQRVWNQQGVISGDSPATARFLIPLMPIELCIWSLLLLPFCVSTHVPSYLHYSLLDVYIIFTGSIYTHIRIIFPFALCVSHVLSVCKYMTFRLNGSPFCRLGCVLVN